MEISCIICSDIFTHNSDIALNSCGHAFHHACLLQWIERSKSCPQCRCRSTEKSIYRVYFNIVNTDHIKDDVGTLQFKLDNAKFKILTTEKRLKEKTEYADSKDAQNIMLREHVSDLEKKLRSCDSYILGLKEKLKMYKTKADEADNLYKQIVQLQSTIDLCSKVQATILATREEVSEILRNESDIETLATLSLSLKNSLMSEQKANNNLRKKLQISLNELKNYKKQCNVLESKSTEMRKELETEKECWDEEKKYLKQKIEELFKELEDKKGSTLQTANSSVHRIMMESPAPLARERTKLLNVDNTTTPEPLSMSGTVRQIMNSDSPYLNSKTNYSFIFNARYCTADQKKSMFKPVKTNSLVPSNSSSSDTVYTGLGGQVKEDYLKFPGKKSPTGLKRVKSSSAVPSSKFRKLAPTSVRKITEFTK